MTFHEHTFENETVNLDSNEFVGCEFIDCTLTYAGGEVARMAHCSFNVMPPIIFTGCAWNTLNVLRALYHGGFRPVVEQTLNDIRADADAEENP